MAVTWDPTKMGSSMVLSNGNLTVSRSSLSQENGIATIGLTVGKWYWEIEVVTSGGSYDDVGVQDGTHTFSDYLGRYADGWGYWAMGRFINNAAQQFVYFPGTSDSAAWTDGDVLGIALDMDSGKLWYSVNGVWVGISGSNPDPATDTDPAFSGLSGTIYPAVGSYAPASVMTARFLNTSLTYTPPTGFSALDRLPIVFEPDSPVQGLGFNDEPSLNRISERGGVAGLGFSAVAGYPRILEQGVTVGIGFNGAAVANAEYHRFGTAGLGWSAFSDAFNFSTIRRSLPFAVYRYYATITGKADGLDDYPMPGFKSFQFRMRTQETSFLSMVLVYTGDLLAAVNARKNGDLVIEMAAVVNGVEILREELIRAGFDSPRYDKGAGSRSLTLVGYDRRRYGGSRIPLEGVQRETMLADGRMQYRCAQPDFYLRAGDVAVYGATEITVDSVSCVVSPQSQYMDVSE